MYANYKTKTRPGLVACVLYDIRPGNGAGQFLQPRSPHGAGLTKQATAGYDFGIERRLKAAHCGLSIPYPLAIHYI